MAVKWSRWIVYGKFGKYEDFLNFSKMTTKTKGDII